MSVGIRRAAVGAGLALVALVAGWLAGTGFGQLTAAWAQPEPVRSPGALLGAGCAGLAGLLLGWLLLGALLCVLGQMPGVVGRMSAALSRRVAPAVLRTGVIAVLGGALVAGSASFASARPTAGPAAPAPIPTAARTVAADAGPNLPSPGWAGAILPAVALPGPGWTPTAPVAPPSTPPADIGLVSPPPAPGRTVDEHVVVRRGETLWAIAARHLGPDATAAEIAVAWPRWYAANRTVIGPDPDLIQPGQLLRPPTTTRGDRP